MQQFADTCEAVAATTKKNEKTSIVAGYFRSNDVATAAVAAVFLSGRPFPAYEERTLQVGGSQLWRALMQVSGHGEGAMTQAYRRHGDLGSAAHDILQATAPSQSTLTLEDVEQSFLAMAGARGSVSKMHLLTGLLARATAVEAKYIVKIMTGELRIGLKESLVEEAIARAFEVPVSQVQRANMLLGDIGGALRLASEDRLEQAQMRLFHPIGFMLASPAESAAQAFEYFEHAVVEDKYDGIRAQVHTSHGEVRIFSRTLDEVSDAFPELVPALAGFADDVILDGEIVAWHSDRNGGGHAMPFSQLQKRLGRKRVPASLMRAIPVAYVAFDVLYAAGNLVLDHPLDVRARLLDDVFTRLRSPVIALAQGPQGVLMFEPAIVGPENANPSSDVRVLRAPSIRADSAEQLERLFGEAQARGNEGLMIKDINSPYTPGRRGRSWLKLKRELATLDVVVTAVEFGHGKRAKVLSDYTFAVRSGDRFVNVGKAYTGLTDAEIAEMTDWFTVHTLVDRGGMREVDARIVVEVAFNAVMRSDRHESGFALRFPRILRLRPDKLPREIDTLERVEEIYAAQHKLPKSA